MLKKEEKYIFLMFNFDTLAIISIKIATPTSDEGSEIYEYARPKNRRLIPGKNNGKQFSKYQICGILPLKH